MIFLHAQNDATTMEAQKLITKIVEGARNQGQFVSKGKFFI